MARTRASEPSAVATLVGAEDPIPSFRRATPEDALAVAVATHLRGERVDMGTLAGQLAISRATLHRWVGSRERLLEQVLAQRVKLFSDAAIAQAEGEGEARVLDALRHVVEAALVAEPARRFVTREPHLALRILTSERGLVHRMLVQALVEMAAETLTPKRVTALKPRIDSAVQVGSLLLYVPITTGEDPQTERIVNIISQLLMD